MPFNWPLFLFLLAIYQIFWGWNLGRLLQRRDLDPVTKLTWVVVMIFVPFFGLVFYWYQVPDPVPERRGNRVFTGENPFPGGPDVRGTPWETNPGHKL